MPGSAGFEEGLKCLGPRSRRTRAALCTGSAPSRVVLIPLSTGQMCFEIYTTDSLVPHVFELKQPIQAFQSRGSLLALGSTIQGLCTRGSPKRPFIQQIRIEHLLYAGTILAVGDAMLRNRHRPCASEAHVLGRQTMTSADLLEAYDCGLAGFMVTCP